MEIEFENEKQANKIKFPQWFGKDISRVVSNSQMAIKDIKKDIEKYNS